MKVTEFGIVTLVNLLHPENAPSPMEVTLFGIVTLVKLLHLLNVMTFTNLPDEFTPYLPFIFIHFPFTVNGDAVYQPQNQQKA